MLLLRFLTDRRTAWLTLLLAVVAVGALFALVPAGKSETFPPSGLPASSQARQVSELLKTFPSANSTAGILVWTRTDGGALTAADRAAITERTAQLSTVSTAPAATRATFSADGTAALTAVPLDFAAATADLAGTAKELRNLASAGLPPGLIAALTGPVGFSADIQNAFAGADFRLLLITVLIVAVLLIVTYRSPVLWIVPLAVVGTADAVAGQVARALADPAGLTLDASISGILSVLVFGAGTNYALLLVARYREELTRTVDRSAAMLAALRGAGPAIAASGGTVALSLLTLLLAELGGNRALGFACAIGIAVAMLFALAVLPAALVVCGRGLFWPFIPRPGALGSAERASLWTRLGRAVARRPKTVVVVATAAIALLSIGLGGYSVGLSQTSQLLGNPESVRGQRVVDAAFSAGLTSQTILLTPDAAAAATTTLARSVPGVASATPGEQANGLTRITVSLKAEPQSDAAFSIIKDLRTTLAAAPPSVADTLVGGTDATALDSRNSAARDQNLLLPLILGIVFAVLALLLRSLVAPILLIASVLATFFASLGASNWLFQNVLGFPAFDTSVTLFAFLFLVALGVDYNIFLTTRAREETAAAGTREGMIRALSATGSVITSAGVLLAAVFAVLGVLPVVALTQIGIIVCIGVLLDTLVVRTVLVPALVFVTGNRFWWPGQPGHQARPAQPRAVLSDN